MKKQTIAVIGASNQHEKFGNKCVRAYLHGGWEVYPVNWSGDTIEGLPVLKNIKDVPVDLDRVSVYLPPPVTLGILGDIAEKGAGEVWMNPGAADAEVFEAARKAGIKAIDGCSIVDIGLSPSQFP